MRIFLDANILFSAAKSDGAIRQLIEILLAGGHECWIDDYVLVEARRNLQGKFPAGVPALEALVPRLHTGRAASPTAAVDDLSWLPEKDRPVLHSAIRLGCDALVTGDQRHFGSGYGKMFSGVTIYSARSLAEAILSAG